jgi:hypothetical protein
VARRFADDAPVDLLLPGLQRFDHLERAVPRPAFLVARDQEGDAPRMVGVVFEETLDGHDHGREAALHVRRAPAVDVAVTDVRLERVGLPFAQVARRYNVRVTGEAEQRRVGAAARPQVGDVAEHHRLAGEPELAEPVREDVLAAGIIRRHGAAPYEVEQQAEYGILQAGCSGS